MIEVNYICAQTKQEVKSTDGLPTGWVIPTEDLSLSDENFSSDIFPKYTVLALSSKDALKKFIKTRREVCIADMLQ